ncbi:hypothetical protein BC830DRAFT_910041 [Chytriomyces sp. MP71]|nr:hypothetical protein BC830DRAFT_910041 [Chytriomyces sp. MP71]
MCVEKTDEATNQRPTHSTFQIRYPYIPQQLGEFFELIFSPYTASVSYRASLKATQSQCTFAADAAFSAFASALFVVAAGLFLSTVGFVFLSAAALTSFFGFTTGFLAVAAAALGFAASRFAVVFALDGVT